MHAVGAPAGWRTSGFEQFDAHGAIVHVQTLANVCCETQMVDIGTISSAISASRSAACR